MMTAIDTFILMSHSDIIHCKGTPGDTAGDMFKMMSQLVTQPRQWHKSYEISWWCDTRLTFLSRTHSQSYVNGRMNQELAIFLYPMLAADSDLGSWRRCQQLTMSATNNNDPHVASFNRMRWSWQKLSNKSVSWHLLPAWQRWRIRPCHRLSHPRYQGWWRQIASSRSVAMMCNHRSGRPHGLTTQHKQN